MLIPLTTSRHRGFTLIELVMVIVLVSVLATVAGPRMIDSSQYQGRMYFDELVAALRYANKYAMSSSCDVEVSLTSGTSGTTVNLFQRSNCSTSPTGSNTGTFGTINIYDPSFNLAIDQLVIPTQITVSSTGLPLYFSSLGQAKNTSTNAISNATIQVGSFSLTIVGGTGYVSD